MAYEFVRVEVDEYIATITLDRPPVNALNRQMYGEIRAAFEGVAASPATDVRVVIITGAGSKAFCAGNELGDMKELTPESMEELLTLVGECFRAVWSCPVPLIGAINGPALGGGTAIATGCDLLVATPNAKFGNTEIKVGSLSGLESMALLPSIKIRWQVLSGRSVPVEELHHLGTVEKVVQAGELMSTARKMAEEIVWLPPLSVRAQKQHIIDTRVPKFWDEWCHLLPRLRKVWETRDCVEAARAFVEKRKPIYEGR